MTWNLENFKEKITSVGLDQYFKVEISAPDDLKEINDIGSDKITALIRTTELPSKNIETQNVAYYGADFKVGSKASYSDWTVTILEEDANGMRELFLNWVDKAYNVDSLVNNPHASYKSNSTRVYRHSTDDSYKSGVTFYGLFPTQVGSLALNQTGGNITTFEVTFTYDYFKRDLSGAQNTTNRK